MQGPLGRGRCVLLLTLLSSLSLLLVGCDITVDTRVSANGAVRRNISIEVPKEDYDLLRRGAEQYLQGGWKFTSRRKTGTRELICSQKFNAREPERMKTITFTRKLSWWIPIGRYKYTEEIYKEDISFRDLLRTEDRQRIAAQTKVTYLLTMPGNIDPQSVPNAKKVQGSTAMWEANANEKSTIEAASTAIRWWWAAFELIVLGSLVWGLMLAINWFGNAVDDWQDHQKTARVEKIRRREEADLLNAQRAAAKEAVRQQQEHERQRKKEENERARQDTDQRVAMEKAAKESERQRAQEEAQKKKDEVRRAKEEKRRPDKGNQ